MSKNSILTYNKDKPSQRRPTMMKSPSTRQNEAKAAAVSDPIIRDLAERLEIMAENLAKLEAGGNERVYKEVMYTEEEFNRTLAETILKEVAVFENDQAKTLQELDLLNEQVAKLEAEVAEQKISLAVKDGIIEELKTIKFVNTGTVQASTPVVKKEVRPTINESMVVDPTEETKLESHIKIKSEVGETAQSSAEKLAKLRKLGLG